ncbi:hypothetical protein WG947_06445 [Pontibacter sp. H259]|uniref:hypothetical protein n=1 Tax=Pontibacter sp. H259 TaxID=3133421 RepID=UPI0030C3E877
MIYIVPNGGLCNRMRVIHSAFLLSEHIKETVKVFWIKDKGLNCNFSDIFSPIESEYLKIIESNKLESYFLYSGSIINFYIPNLFHKLYFSRVFTDRNNQIRSLKINQFDFTKLKKYNRVLISTCEDFYSIYNSYNIFKPVTELQVIIDREIKHFNSSTIGIHIRRTDNSWSIENSPIGMFKFKMQEEIRLKIDTMFFLATDDVKIKEELIMEFPNRIISFDRKLDRNSEKGIKDAAVELYTLASTSKIYGSYWSSFSEIAAKLFDAQLETITLNNNS